MIPIILCSIASLAICIERWSALRIERVVPRGTLAEVWEWIRRDDLGAQRMRTLRAGSPLGRVLSAGLANAHHGREVMKESIEEEAGHVIHELERYLDALGTIASIAPLLG
ncbi:MAG: MotA/TolQ/ExbB proton channel family protein, partial [Gammaproteobacteria bacterium]